MSVTKKNKKEIEAFLEMLASTKSISDSRTRKNIFIVNTPKGQMKYESELSYDEFLETFRTLKKNKKKI